MFQKRLVQDMGELSKLQEFLMRFTEMQKYISKENNYNIKANK